MLARIFRVAAAASIALLAIGVARPAAAQQPTDSTAAKAAPQHVEITLAPEALDAFVGEYQVSPMGGTMTIVVTREGSQLYEQATMQPRFQIFPESPNGFFLKVVDAQMTFSRDATGKVTGIVVHQNGMEFPGPKVK